ncbi:hypothetical protein ACFQY5_19975 [Paeniroseomonas aquatica]|uniref:hypothetical protein n=1 Tax=Paeniroseomonas aquatica TaxID=373043 RepID=UPI0036241D43
MIALCFMAVLAALAGLATVGLALGPLSAAASTALLAAPPSARFRSPAALPPRSSPCGATAEAPAGGREAPALRPGCGRRALDAPIPRC